MTSQAPAEGLSYRKCIYIHIYPLYYIANLYLYNHESQIYASAVQF